jgi:enoyl-CoA hydratase
MITQDVVTGIHFSVDEQGIGTLTVNRPEVRNALNWAAMDDFSRSVEAAQTRTDLRALIVTGAGETFVSGGDLRELQHYPSRADGHRLTTIMGNALARLEALPCPTIAAVGGPARGGGAEIAVACDLRIMSENADIGFVHTRLGIITAWGGGQRLLRIVGYATALELLATGRVVRSEEARTIRLVNWVCPEGDTLGRARGLALQIAANPPSAVQASKRVLRLTLTDPDGAPGRAERAEFPPLWDSEFRREKVRQFLEKSK